MSNELTPEGPELTPDSVGGFGEEEVGSEDASHLLPPIRELPTDREYLPGAFYAIRAEDGTPGDPPEQLGQLLGQALFQSLQDVHIFGRGSDSEPWIEVGPMTPEPVQILVAQELVPGSGEAQGEDDLEMFEMVGGRVAKTLKRENKGPEQNKAEAAKRSEELVAMKGQLNDTVGMALAGDFQLADVADCALSLGLKRKDNRFVWYGGHTMGDPIFEVTAEGAELTPGAQGGTPKVNFTFTVAAVKQPNKVLERMFAAVYYFRKRLGGEVLMADGNPPGDGVARGEDPSLQATVKKIEDAGLRPGHIVTRRLV